MSRSQEPEIEDYLAVYMGRGLVLSVVGSLSGAAGVLFSFGLIYTRIIPTYLTYVGDYVGVDPRFLFDTQDSVVISVAQTFAGQWLALAVTGILFIIFTLVIGGVRQFRNGLSSPKEAFTHTTHKSAVIATGHQLVLVGIPLTLGITGTLIFYSMGAYSNEIISEKVAKQIFLSGILMTPTLTFFEISVLEITR